MMKHEEYRRAVLTILSVPIPSFEAHRASCEDCRAFTDGVLTFEHRLVRALEVSTPISARFYLLAPAAQPSTKGRVGWLWQRRGDAFVVGRVFATEVHLGSKLYVARWSTGLSSRLAERGSPSGGFFSMCATTSAARMERGVKPNTPPPQKQSPRSLPMQQRAPWWDRLCCGCQKVDLSADWRYLPSAHAQPMLECKYAVGKGAAILTAGAMRFELGIGTERIRQHRAPVLLVLHHSCGSPLVSSPHSARTDGERERARQHGGLRQIKFASNLGG